MAAEFELPLPGPMEQDRAVDLRLAGGGQQVGRRVVGRDDELRRLAQPRAESRIDPPAGKMIRIVWVANPGGQSRPRTITPNM